ncbi:MAG: hypothetical protein HC877_01495 [Thioploca sp.]|nr:hypothetical protein [Thioploca sp.]
MTHGTPFYLILILFNLLTQPIALATCCSSHGGICNKEKCCDNTPLSTDCGDIRLIKLPPLASLTLPQASEPTKPNKAQPESQSVIPPPSWLYIWQDQKRVDATYQVPFRLGTETLNTLKIIQLLKFMMKTID